MESASEMYKDLFIIYSLLSQWPFTAGYPVLFHRFVQLPWLPSIGIFAILELFRFLFFAILLFFFQIIEAWL